MKKQMNKEEAANEEQDEKKRKKIKKDKTITKEEQCIYSNPRSKDGRVVASAGASRSRVLCSFVWLPRDKDRKCRRLFMKKYIVGFVVQG